MPKIKITHKDRHCEIRFGPEGVGLGPDGRAPVCRGARVRRLGFRCHRDGLEAL